VSLDRIEVNGVPLVAAALDSYDQAQPPRAPRRCDECGALTGMTVFIPAGLPKPGRYCRSCLALRDATLGVKAA